MVTIFFVIVVASVEKIRRIFQEDSLGELKVSDQHDRTKEQEKSNKWSLVNFQLIVESRCDVGHVKLVTDSVCIAKRKYWLLKWNSHSLPVGEFELHKLHDEEKERD